MYTIQGAKASLKDGIEIYLQKDEEKKYVMKEVNRLPFYLEGSPGIGKTEIVRQVADELGIGYVSFSLTHHTRNSLLGLPVIKDLECGKYTEYTMSEIIVKVIEAKEAGDDEGILLLDEFSCVSDSIFPAMLAFLQTKNIGMHSLPEGWVIVLCGNPPEYNRNARRFDAAILDRIRRISVAFDPQVFLAYAKENAFHPVVCSYLELNPSHVYCCENVKKEQILVTCRGWENLSHALYGVDQLEKQADESMVKQFIKSDEVAYEFMKFYNLNRVGITEQDIDNIICGNNPMKYYEKYADRDYGVWWNMLDVLEDHLKTKHRELDNKTRMIHLAENIIEELNRGCNIGGQIKRRLGEISHCYDLIPRWDSATSRYVEMDDLEKQLLETWLDALESNSEERWDDWEDKDVRRIISNCTESMKAECPTEFKQLSKEISNVIQFLKPKDETLVEKFYQIINHTELFLQAMVTVKNKDYIELCKKNYAVGA